MALISCPECGKEVSDRAPACIHCGYPLSSAAPYADFRPITGPNRFTVRLTARPAYPDARSRTLRALMKELGLSREQGIRLLEQARREPVPLREGLTEEEALALLEVFRRAGLCSRYAGQIKKSSAIRAWLYKEVKGKTNHYGLSCPFYSM